MEKYHCSDCNYTIKSITDFKKHVVSKKHIANSGSNTLITDFSKFKKKIYCCEICDVEFFSAASRYYHKKKCHNSIQHSDQSDDVQPDNHIPQPSYVNPQIHDNTNIMDMFKSMQSMQLSQTQTMQAMQITQNQTMQAMHSQIASLISLAQSNANAVEKSASAVEKFASATEKTANVANKSMNMLKYANVHFPDAPPLKKLNKKEAYGMLGYDNPKNLEEDNENYVKLVLANYENKNVANFFGDLIVNYYKEDDVKDVRFWSADVARLCFVVMHTINKDGKKEWANDKSGKKFTAMVIYPMFEALKIIFEDFLKFKARWQKKCVNPTRNQMDFVINARQKCMELLKDLKYDKYTQQVLKIVAPNFDFSTYKSGVSESAENTNLDNGSNHSNLNKFNGFSDSESSSNNYANTATTNSSSDEFYAEKFVSLSDSSEDEILVKNNNKNKKLNIKKKK